jgi:preprotein translocase subunit SecF
MEILKNPSFDFLGKARYFVILSLVLLAATVGWIVTRGLTYGIEFSEGTQLIVKFQNPPEIDKIRDAVGKASSGATILTYGEPSRNNVLIRAGSDPTATELDTVAKRVLQALAEGYAANPVVESSSEIVGAVVSSDLRQKAIILTVLGLVFQLIYIAIRFKGGIWGAAASLAALHDVVICIGFLALFHYEITLNVVAALLTLVGYSVNDTIVIFDRVRENLRQRRKDALGKVINDSLNQTLTRTLISNGTTFLAVLGLYLFGGEVLRGFGFAMVVGILVGTYSTIYIAAPLVVWWNDRARPAQPSTAKAAL